MKDRRLIVLLKGTILWVQNYPQKEGIFIFNLSVFLLHEVKQTAVISTVKPVFKGHCDEGTPCDQETLSQNRVLSSPW